MKKRKRERLSALSVRKMLAYLRNYERYYNIFPDETVFFEFKDAYYILSPNSPNGYRKIDFPIPPLSELKKMRINEIEMTREKMIQEMCETRYVSVGVDEGMFGIECSDTAEVVHYATETGLVIYADDKKILTRLWKQMSDDEMAYIYSILVG